ncbi:MAG: translation elongation factor Ts [Hyphomicrobiaceae bacterium]
MTTVPAPLVKQLRDKTGAGMMDCKRALVESGADMAAAVDWLRKKGLAKAANTADRIAADGLIGVTPAGKRAAIVEVNSETDFVARNEKFQDMVRTIVSLAPKADGDMAKLLAMTYPGSGQTVEDYVKAQVATIGEKMAVRRTAALKVGTGLVVDYVHNKLGDGLGKMGVLVALNSKGKKDALLAFGRQLAMHVAAANPQAVTAEDLDPALIERERAIYKEQAKTAGKPAHVIDKVAEAALNREFFRQVVLMQQVFVVDGKSTVAQAVEAAQKDIGAPIKIAGFVRYVLGEGIDKKDGDFAAEVAAAAKKR